MNKKLNFEISRVNLAILIITIFGTLTFMLQLTNALDTIKSTGTLNSIEYNIFQVKMRETNHLFGVYNRLYIIDNYPLISITAGVIYNIRIMIKNRLKGKKGNE